MNILVLGSGGRECALVWKIKQSPFCDNLYIAPGNAGTSEYGKNVDLSINDFEQVKDFCLQKDISILVVGPEDPLVNGIADYFNNNSETKHINVVGPQKNGAILEGSKDFAKKFMQKYSIPTAAYQSFDKNTIEKAKQFLNNAQPPYVIKADGLAAGKGVVICNDLQEAYTNIDEMLLKDKFGKAGSKIVIEEFLYGMEISVFVITDGENYLLLPEAKDYKRIGDNDTGLNTGGMGAVSPVPFANETFINKVKNRIIKPTINGLKSEGVEYKGFIFLGLMKVNEDPYVIEYNVRLGDPEAEAILPRLNNDIVEIFNALPKKELKNIQIDISNKTCVTLILASEGYPGNYEKGKIIKLPVVCDKTIFFHSGTKFDKEKNEIVSNGGRVLAISVLDDSLRAAIDTAYKNANLVSMENKYFRKDIGKDLIPNG